MKYIISEVQTIGETVNTLVWSFDNENAAWAKYHSILSGAATSGLTAHSAIFFTNEGTFVEGKCFKNEPAPEEES